MDVRRALQVIAARCSRREVSSLEARAWLTRQELTAGEVEGCVARLQEWRLVDDERFAMAYARDAFRLKRWGRFKIEQALRRRRLPEASISRALASLDDTGGDEKVICLSLLRRKDEVLKEEDPYKREVKLIRFAMGRGFGLDTIRRALALLRSSPGE